MTKQWDQYEATIRALYAEHTLSTVRQIMIERHGFNASVRAYRGRLDRWNVRKYNKRNRNGSVSSASGSDGRSTTPAASRYLNRGESALGQDGMQQNQWHRNDAAPVHHHHLLHGASINTTADQPPPYSPSQYAKRKYSQRYNQTTS